MRKIKISTMATFVIYIFSFFLPVDSYSFKDSSTFGYEAAWMVLKAVLDLPDNIKDWITLLIAWPTNILIVLTFILLLLEKTKYIKYLATYGLIGQLYWLFNVDIQISELGIGYWLWLVAGIGMFIVTFMSTRFISIGADFSIREKD